MNDLHAEAGAEIYGKDLDKLAEHLLSILEELKDHPFFYTFFKSRGLKGDEDVRVIAEKILEVVNTPSSSEGRYPGAVVTFAVECWKAWQDRTHPSSRLQWRKGSWAMSPFVHRYPRLELPEGIRGVDLGISYRSGELEDGRRRVSQAVSVARYVVEGHDPEELPSGANTYTEQSTELASSLDAWWEQGKRKPVQAVRSRLSTLTRELGPHVVHDDALTVHYQGLADEALPKLDLMDRRLLKEALPKEFRSAISHAGILPVRRGTEPTGALYCQVNGRTYVLEESGVKLAPQTPSLESRPSGAVAWWAYEKAPTLEIPTDLSQVTFDQVRTIWARTVGDADIVGSVKDGRQRR